MTQQNEIFFNEKITENLFSNGIAWNNFFSSKNLTNINFKYLYDHNITFIL